ncbi:glucosamine-6-phosphate deaminase [Pseudalkalibacillus berkeleyi]|uniref:Glucosamine-6-phosphate deaminase n=1 Tax=Pseudalkalibacillus berkeleyi TaxID=1069813 RepID=A0ABS9GYC6_9BACL|nr:glucosamine-6-phosphate deaminase [Pseudalkalibacillus berkeleyi]MCF6137772.1 glucosamine-6-phosphate deaminase [Pseudalkalibacillus berkeleyi]
MRRGVNVNIITVDHHKHMSKIASEFIYEAIHRNPNLVLGVATGSTPEQTYERLVEKIKQDPIDLSKLKTVNLDEYVGLPREHEESYWQYMIQHLYAPLELSIDQGLVPDGMSANLDEECIQYERKIERLGGIDLQMLGVGVNGHIGFNEPGTSFDSNTHVVELTESTRIANARFFQNQQDVPTKAITVGISTIMKSRSIILLASGNEKATAVSTLLKGEVSPEWPVTILNQHDDVTLIVTKDAIETEEPNA